MTLRVHTRFAVLDVVACLAFLYYFCSRMLEYQALGSRR